MTPVPLCPACGKPQIINQATNEDPVGAPTKKTIITPCLMFLYCCLCPGVPVPIETMNDETRKKWFKSMKYKVGKSMK